MKIAAGLVSLSLVLLYNFVHTGNVLAAFVDPQWVGYAAAFGIESIVIFLSAQISERRKVGRDTNLFVGALVAVVVVSAFANIAQGYLVKFGKPLEMVVFGATDFAQLVVWLSSTGLLSLVTFAMAEIIGDDITASSQDKAQPVVKTESKRNSRIAAWFDRLRYRDGIKQWNDESAAFIDKISASPAQGVAQAPQVGETDEIGPLDDCAGQDTALESPQTATGSDLSVSVPENALTTVIEKSPLKSPVLSAVTFDGYTPTGNTRVDVASLLGLAPLATNASMARKLCLSDERVRQVRLSLSQEAQGVAK